jgi:hypothetical protein
MLAFNKSDFDLGERVGGKNMENLKFDKESLHFSSSIRTTISFPREAKYGIA